MSHDAEPPPVDVLCRINARCDEFEAVCRTGRGANANDYLDGFTGPDRVRLLQQLIPLELDYRKQQGLVPSFDDILNQFPELDSTWLSAAVADDGAAPATEGGALTGIEQSEGHCSVETAWQRLVDAQLLVIAESDALKTQLPSTAVELTARLVAEGKLTAFQARRLCAATPRPLVLGGYLLQDRIGSGGMGTVYRALHRRMNREVALKLLKPGSDGSADRSRWFQREAEAAAKLVHPNIVTAYDAGEAEGVAFLVTEFIAGMDLAALVQRDGPLPVATAIKYISQAACGLAYAHSQGIIHRDVKPSNLLVDQDGKVRVLDVGLARLTRGPTSDATNNQPPSAEQTSLGALIGTVDYMAPEQAAAPTNVTERADIYSLGCTLYYLLTGRAMYPGTDVWAKLAAHRDEAVPSLTTTRPEVTPALHRLFQSMVAKRPVDRPPSMDEVEGRLKRIGVPRRRGLMGAEAALLAVSIGALVWWMGLWPFDGGRATTDLATVPFDAAAYQKEWADRLHLPVETEVQFTMRFVFIPPGRFRSDGGPLQSVTEPFYLSRTEVTIYQFREYLREAGRITHVERSGRTAWGRGSDGWTMKTGFRWSHVGADHPLTDEHPASNICWQDVLDFADWLTQQSSGRLRFRPPTEAEWEFAGGGGNNGPWCSGQLPSELAEFAWYKGSMTDQRFRPVGLKRPNGFGLYDMHGNLAEWCSTDGAPVCCGGHFNSDADQIRLSARLRIPADRPSAGIRLVLEVGPRVTGPKSR